jgi:N-dimethylarginine dimethylaminohydrolase
MFGAQSEYFPLKKVIMHAPSQEIHYVTEKNKREFLFRSPAEYEKMREEHANYVQFLTDEGVEVILSQDSVCPNLVFTRDVASVTNTGALLMRPMYPARCFEPVYLKKLFDSMEIPTMEITRGTAEGGDLVYLDEDTLMIGFGPRTDLDGVMAIRELVCDAVKTILAVPLPSFRVHLDGALMILDKDVAIVHPGSVLFPAKFLHEEELVLIPDFLKEEGFDLIEVTDEEVYNFGPNIFVVKPGVVVSYSWNTRIISELEERSMEVFGLEGHELVKAGGGPHCMTCPVLREI